MDTIATMSLLQNCHQKDEHISNSNAQDSLKTTAVDITRSVSVNNSEKESYQFYTNNNMTTVLDTSTIDDSSNLFSNFIKW